MLCRVVTVFGFKKRLVSKSLSALSASSLEYLSAVSSSHSLSEAMLNLSLALLRLVSSKHSYTSLN